MSNLRKEAFRRMQELKQQKVGSTTITLPNVTKTRPKVRRRTDEIHAELVDEFWKKVEEKSIDLSRWDGQGSPWEHRHILD
jgi:hypothetical protein